MESLAETKVCTKCGIEKRFADFHACKRNKTGRKSECRACIQKRSKAYNTMYREQYLSKRKAEWAKCRDRYAARNKSPEGKVKRLAWKLRKYGMSLDDYRALLIEQGGVCAICKDSAAEAVGHNHRGRLHIDHDHETGKVRGLLCNLCNAGIGYFRDDLRRLESAITYLSTTEIGSADRA